ncbi:GTPase Era [Roseospira marina]|uniref:GTPase Era n=1 Tax=Roseospira marina TaxID=140057 RepID=A0A5M6IA92_9PROT|nr:GTPase Era [Roseospira marina]KAA5604598.1 GTPase Era [Roseospira marina]MBB4315349.1 GTP-binding protein Era [Roseospira marina]MBB5088348.1 GTP-binding protein Era [Roseospira marina]
MTDDLEPAVPAAEEGDSRCSFVAVVGAPNAGKSTLVNTLVGTKVSIVSPKVQTTRTRVRGVALHGPAQIVFIDTPGIFTPKRRLERSMVAAAWDGAADADQVMVVVDAHRGLDDDTRAIIAGLREQGRTDCLLALNKIDMVRRDSLLALAAALNDEGVFRAVFMISALKADGTEDLIALLAREAPTGPWMYPEDEISDLPQRLWAAEITREQIFHQLHQELPYSALVDSESWQERADGSVRIDQVIYVQRDSQRAIVLGKGGSRIRALSTAARQEMSALLERPVHLFLFVKVHERLWEDRRHYADWGLDYDV